MSGVLISISARAAISAPAFQPFLQSPGGVLGIARLHQEKKRGVEAEAR